MMNCAVLRVLLIPSRNWSRFDDWLGVSLGITAKTFGYPSSCRGRWRPRLKQHAKLEPRSAFRLSPVFFFLSVLLSLSLSLFLPSHSIALRLSAHCRGEVMDVRYIRLRARKCFITNYIHQKRSKCILRHGHSTNGKRFTHQQDLPLIHDTCTCTVFIMLFINLSSKACYD